MRLTHVLMSAATVAITAASAVLAMAPAASAATVASRELVHSLPGAETPGRAAYQPCSTITWAYDRAEEPDGSMTLVTDIQGALALLSGHTGLAFEQAEFGTTPDIRFDWGDVGDDARGVQATAWRSGVTFVTGSEMTLDRWAGFSRRAIAASDGSYDVGNGRGWLVVHEVMHALGFSHSMEVESVMAATAEIANVWTTVDRRRELRFGRRSALSAGDLAGLAALYPRAGCTTP